MLDRDPMMNDRDKKIIPTTFRTGFIGTFLVFCNFLFQILRASDHSNRFSQFRLYKHSFKKFLMDTPDSRFCDPSEISRDEFRYSFTKT